MVRPNQRHQDETTGAQASTAKSAVQPAAGPKALARRDAALRQFTGFLGAGRAETSVELPGITSLSIAGGINELLYSEILHGATARLESRLPDLMFWIVLPFLGPERAAEERDRIRLSAEREAEEAGN